MIVGDLAIAMAQDLLDDALLDVAVQGGSSAVLSWSCKRPLQTIDARTLAMNMQTMSPDTSLETAQ